MAAVDPMKAAILRVRARFLEVLVDRCDHVERLLACSGRPPRDVAEAALTAIHQTAGSAGTLGLGNLSDAAFDCEDALRSDLVGPNIATVNGITEETRRHLEHFVALAKVTLRESQRITG